MKKQILLLLPLFFLLSCQEKKETSSFLTTDSTATTTTSKIEETTIEKKTYTFTSSDLLETEQSKYLENIEIQKEDFVLEANYIQRGTGSYQNTIQMKKGVSYFYNKEKRRGTITLSVLDKGEYTGTPTLYIGEEENPDQKVEWESKKQESNSILYQASFTNYFKVKDESNYALYLNFIQIEA